MNQLLAVALLTATLLSAQSRNPVQWTTEPVPGSPTRVTLQATMEPGWHIYALTSPAGGPTPTTIKLSDTKVASEIKLYQPKPSIKFDPNFNLNVEAFEGSVRFLVAITP